VGVVNFDKVEMNIMPTEINGLFEKNIDLLAADLDHILPGVLQDYQQLRQIGNKGELSHIYISFLLSGVLCKLPWLRIDLYDENDRGDTIDCFANWDTPVISDMLYHDVDMITKQDEWIEDYEVEQIWLDAAGEYFKGFENAMPRIIDKCASAHTVNCQWHFGQFLGNTTTQGDGSHVSETQGDGSIEETQVDGSIEETQVDGSLISRNTAQKPHISRNTVQKPHMSPGRPYAFFKLGQDNRVPYGVLLTDLSNIGGYYESKKGDLTQLDDAFVSLVRPSPVNFYPDILDRQLFMIKGAVKEVFDMFMPDLEYKHCCLIDNVNEKYEEYFIPVLDVLDWDMATEGKRHVFRLACASEVHVVASVEVVEAVLRRKAVGVEIANEAVCVSGSTNAQND